MYRAFTTFLLSLALIISGSNVGFAQDFEAGATAYKRGDYATAIREFRGRAEQGDATAQVMLGTMYGLGRGVPQDFIYAHMWLNIGAANGDERGAKARVSVESLMTVEQIFKAQELASQCVQKSYKGC